MLTAASALLLASCAKETGNGFDAVLSFSADTPELVETRAAAATNVTDFFTIGYGSSQWFPSSGGPQRVQISSGSATFDTYKWKLGDSKTFYAYSNNLPTSGATATIASSGVTLTYTAIPTEASAQTDVTLGRYSGNGDNKGTAAMTFYHPLAQVVFKMGDMAGVSKIDKIEIKGVYNAGTTTLSTSTTVSSGVAQFSWTGISGSEKVSQTVNSLPSKGSEFGTPFMLIPQDLATQNVTVSVTVTTTGGSSVTLTKELSSGSFATGKKTVCTLTVNPARELGCNLAAYTADAEDDIFKKTIEISSFADLNDFRIRVENGENFSGKTVEFTEDIISTESFVGINDELGVLDNVTFEGKNHTLSLKIAKSSEETSIFSGFFYKMTSSNVRFSNITWATSYDDNSLLIKAGVVVADYLGSKISFENCIFSNCIAGSPTIYGGIIAYTEGDVAMIDCTVSKLTTGTTGLVASGRSSYISAIVGYAKGDVQLDYSRCIVQDCSLSFSSVVQDWYCGFLLGNGEGNININITDCNVQNNNGFYIGSYDMPTHLYYNHEWTNNTWKKPLHSGSEYPIPNSTQSALIGCTILTAKIQYFGVNVENNNTLKAHSEVL